MASETGTTRTDTSKLMAPPAKRGGMFCFPIVFPMRILGCEMIAQQLKLGERAGTRTQDLLKRQPFRHFACKIMGL